MANKITYEIDFKTRKEGLQQLKSSLQEIKNLNFKDLMKINDTDLKSAKNQFMQIKNEVLSVEKALSKAFNTKLNTVNIQTFNRALKEQDTTIEKVYEKFKLAGAAGENAFRNLSSQVFRANKELKESHSLLDNMATTLANTIKWNIASSAVNSLSNSIQQAWGYTKALDTSLNDIRIVTGKTSEQMGNFAEKANEVAQNLGRTTVDYTKASLIYAQQGIGKRI